MKHTLVIVCTCCCYFMVICNVLAKRKGLECMHVMNKEEESVNEH